MSRTAEHRANKRNWLLSCTVPVLTALLLSTAPAGAQGLENLFDQAAEADTASSEQNNALIGDLQTKIDERLAIIAGRISQEPEDIDPSALTVEDLDRLQRDAARALSIQERRSAEYAAIREEIELLMFLQTSVNEIEAARNPTPIEPSAGVQIIDGVAVETTPSVDVEALRAQWEAEKAAEAEQVAAATAAANDAQEKASIPRLAAIKGAAGQWEAEIESAQGVMQYVTSGDALADGFTVESIDSKTVVIKAIGSGARYSLIPSPPMGEASGGQARDMATGGGSGTF
jgi:type IV pilus biogenesis protein PilP